MNINVGFILMSEYARVPSKPYKDDAGHDLFVSREQTVPAGMTVDVNTDIMIEIPEGWYVHILPRSSALPSTGLLVQSGVIDAGYRGELYFQVHNPGRFPVKIEEGDRLCQILFLPVPTVKWERKEKLNRSNRGENGFGSTGR